MLATISYILLILIINTCFSYLPSIELSAGNQVSIADVLVGFIYLARDFSQREIGHYVIVAMLIGAGISYLLADPTIAKASIMAFLIAEGVDWTIFSLTGWTLAKRLLLSAAISAPVDSYVFLYVAHILNPLEFIVMTAIKWLGVLLLWWLWRIKQSRALRNQMLTS